MKKNYVIDTSVLLDDENCIDILRNGEQNNVYIPHTVLLELDNLKKDRRLCYAVSKVVSKIESDKKIFLMDSDFKNYKTQSGDLKIIEEIYNSSIKGPIIVTNDALFRLICKSKNIQSEEFRSSSPYESESQMFTGFQKEGDVPVNNAFTWMDGKPYFNHPDGKYVLIDYQNVIWGVKPLNVYQNLAMELLLNDSINLITIQSKAGQGKTYLSLAASLHKVLQDKLYKKIYLVKPTVEIGESLGFLPGTIEEKLDPYIKYIRMLILKLHNARGSKNSKIFTDDSNGAKLKLNPEIFEFLPIQYIRGMNIEDSFVIVDEMQNFSRLETRSLLSRMGKNTKCVCLGCVDQIDNRYLNKFNNGLNWIVKMCLGDRIYSHIVLKGDRSRGPICDLVLKTGL